MESNETLALNLASDRKQLLFRMREAVNVMYPRYAKFFQRKFQRFDFEAKRLHGFDGFYLQWTLRQNPELPEAYENQQTSVGCVALNRLSAD